MEFEGKVYKSSTSRYWLAEVPFLDLMTQGRTKKEVLEMLTDAVLELLLDSYSHLLDKSFGVYAQEYGKELVGIGATDDRFLMALGLKRQREISGTTIRQAARRLKSDSPNAYARYERGKVRPSMKTYELLIRAANPEKKSLLIA